MKQKVFRVVADLRFSIFILLLISFCSIAGTIIEQDQSIEIYKMNYPLTNPVFGFLTWDRILQFGLDHVYKTWWFFTLIFLSNMATGQTFRHNIEEAKKIAAKDNRPIALIFSGSDWCKPCIKFKKEISLT